MSYRALYRVWRPQQFSDVVGQEHVTKTLKNALREGHLSHAYLFHGPRGTGKTSIAKIFAKAVNCEHGIDVEPCNECDSCRRITDGSLMDVVEIDAASNRGVDEIRELRDKVKFAPTEVRYKVYIIDEVHMLTTEAFNALLKTLEEPPSHVVFILATTEPHKLPPTIISRCQRFAFRRISFEQIVNHLKLVCDNSQVQYEEAALFALAHAADGGMRDALSLLDQALSFGGDRLDESTVVTITGSVSKEVMVQLMEDIASSQPASALRRLEECIQNGLEPDKLIQDLIQVCRDLLLFKTAPQMEQWHTEESFLTSQSDRWSIAQLSYVLDQLVKTEQQMKWVSHPQILLEMLVVRLCEHQVKEVEAAPSQQLEKLEQRIRTLEEEIARLKQGESLKTNQQLPQSLQQSRMKKQSIIPTRISLNREQLSKSNSAQLDTVRRLWPDVLRRVKDENIMIHAWLMDGEPVATTEESVIVAFKSKIHRETTEKESHKTLIEQTLFQILGKPFKLKTVMLDEWREWLNQRKSESVSEKASETVERNQVTSTKEEEVYQRAVQLFGEDLVKLADSEKHQGG